MVSIASELAWFISIGLIRGSAIALVHHGFVNAPSIVATHYPTTPLPTTPLPTTPLPTTPLPHYPPPSPHPQNDQNPQQL